MVELRATLDFLSNKKRERKKWPKAFGCWLIFLCDTKTWFMTYTFEIAFVNELQERRLWTASAVCRSYHSIWLQSSSHKKSKTIRFTLIYKRQIFEIFKQFSRLNVINLDNVIITANVSKPKEEHFILHLMRQSISMDSFECDSNAASKMKMFCWCGKLDSKYAIFVHLWF